MIETLPRPATATPPDLPQSIAERGKAIYEREIKALVEPQHNGKYVFVEVESGEWGIADTQLQLAQLVLQRDAHAARFVMRIGSQTLMRAGHRLSSALKAR